MPNGFLNWNFKQVTAILTKNDFRLNHVKGSHFYYVGHQGNKMRQVCVPNHGKKSFKPRTFKSMLIQSGLPKEKWGI